MACNNPLLALRREDGSITFDRRDRNQTGQLLLACGRCWGCRLQRSRHWSIRCSHEASLYDLNAFITLTYNDEHLPEHSNLIHRDFQLFMKRLRQHLMLGREGIQAVAPKAEQKGSHSYGAPPHPPTRAPNVRYYMAGEYTDDGRPHFHACLFGIDFTDKKLFKTKGDTKLYTSKTLEQLWKKGFVTTGDVTIQSAAYIARYVMKKITGPNAAQHYEYVDLVTGEIIQKNPEYNRMSLKPGIGATWLEKFHQDTYPRGTLIVNGKQVKPPRYYDQKMKELNPEQWEITELNRYKEAQKKDTNDDTPQRREVKDRVIQARLTKNLPRNLK